MNMETRLFCLRCVKAWFSDTPNAFDTNFGVAHDIKFWKGAFTGSFRGRKVPYDRDDLQGKFRIDVSGSGNPIVSIKVASGGDGWYENPDFKEVSVVPPSFVARHLVKYQRDEMKSNKALGRALPIMRRLAPPNQKDDIAAHLLEKIDEMRKRGDSEKQIRRYLRSHLIHSLRPWVWPLVVGFVLRCAGSVGKWIHNLVG